jgi:hypothetical protein
LAIGIVTNISNEFRVAAIREARCVDQHGRMRGLLSPRIPDGPGNDEGAHRTHEAFWQHIDRMVDLVLQRQNVLVVIDQP